MFSGQFASDIWPYAAIYLGWFGLLAVANTQARAIRTLLYAAFAISLTIVIGLRFQVGGDWGSYAGGFEWDQSRTFGEILTGNEVGRHALNKIAGILNNGYQVTNLFYAAIFSAGISFMLFRLPYSEVVWLALCPLFVFLLAMGYMRQSLVVGALAAVATIPLVPFVFLLVVGLVCIGFQAASSPFLAMLIVSQTRSWKVLLALAILTGTMLYISWPIVGFKINSYFMSAFYVIWPNSTYQISELIGSTSQLSSLNSKGALPRTVLIAAPCLFVLFQRQGVVRSAGFFPFKVVAVFALLLVPMSIFASTLADRLAYFCLPSFALGVSLIAQQVQIKYLWVLRFIVGSIYGGTVLVWFAFADHASSWLPYQLNWQTVI